MSSAVALSLVVVIVIVAIDLWVYADARARADQGAPVVLRVGSFAVDTPTAWLLACLLMWVIFFPLYLSSRN